MQIQFWFYMIFYVCPYSLTLITEDHEVSVLVLKICIFPQVILLSIKLVQLKVQGRKFLTGWNIIDVMQIVCF